MSNQFFEVNNKRWKNNLQISYPIIFLADFEDWKLLGLKKLEKKFAHLFFSSIFRKSMPKTVANWSLYEEK